MNSLSKAFQKGLTKYDYTCRLHRRTGSGKEQLHIVDQPIKEETLKYLKLQQLFAVRLTVFCEMKRNETKK